MKSIIDDLNLAKEGESKQLWFREKMPLVNFVNNKIRKFTNFLKEKL